VNAGRAVVFAYSSIGCECLAELLESGVEVGLVFTHEDDPNEEKWFASLREAAESRGLPVRTPPRPGDDDVRVIRDLAPDLIFSFSYRRIIPESILTLARLGAFNIHGALLPRYRGRACVNHAVLNGETETGVTLHHMTARVDEGRIVDREAVPIGPDDTAHDVFKKLIPASRKMLHRSLPAILRGEAYGVEQDESQATYFGRRRPEDGLIDWSKGAGEIYNLVRAVTHPFPGAFSFLNGRKLFIWSARPHPGEECTTPGVVVSSCPLKASTGRGFLQILRAQWSAEAVDRKEVSKEVSKEVNGEELRLPAGTKFVNNEGHED
jgi:methionyl-tRNA formyltransferase